MRILSTQSYNNYQYGITSPNFRSWRKEVFISDTGGRTIENLKHTTATWMFRKSPDWKKLTAFLAEKYRDASHVNVYDYACSNGSEAYTFLIALINDLGYDKARKFMPVAAKDYDGGAIYRGVSGIIELDADEISDIDIYTDGNFEKYFSSKYNDSKYNIRKWNVNPLLKSNVNFSTADILKDYKSIKPDNSIVFVRNFWPYLKIENRTFLAKNLYSQLGRNSLLITGSFDRQDPINQRPIEPDLISAGFKRTDVDYVFSK